MLLAIHNLSMRLNEGKILKRMISKSEGNIFSRTTILDKLARR